MYDVYIMHAITYQTLCDLQRIDGQDVEAAIRKAIWDSKGIERPVEIKVTPAI